MKALRTTSRRSAAIALVFLWALASPSLLLAQDEKRKDGEGKKGREEFPNWSVNGVLATDLSAVLAPHGNRDTMPDRGIAGEYAIGGTFHAARTLSVNVRACVGCHGFEMQSAYADYSFDDAFIVRVGRLPVPFGGMSQRTSPAQVESSSKPLPYIMGWMVRRNEFNLGIVPSPIIDNGAEILGNAWLGDSVQWGYEAAVVRGLKGTSPDIDFVLSRDFRDNNGEPAAAARTTLAAGPFTLGASGMIGHYDPDHRLSYGMGEADLAVHLGDWNVRLEGVWRKTEFLDAVLEEQDSRRLGYVAQIDVALSPEWRLFFLHDALKVEHLFLTSAGPQPSPSPGSTDDSNTIYRFVGGAIWAVRPGFLIKGSAEYWNFSDFRNTGVFHLEIVIEF